MLLIKRSHCSSYAILHQAMCRDSRIVPGAAATEIELAKRLKEFSFKETGYLFDTSLYTAYGCWNCISPSSLGLSDTLLIQFVASHAILFILRLIQLMKQSGYFEAV